MHVFNVAFAVAHLSGNTKYGCFICSAHSEAEAIGVGITYARERFSTGDNFSNHTAIATQVSTTQLLELLANSVGTSILPERI